MKLTKRLSLLMIVLILSSNILTYASINTEVEEIIKVTEDLNVEENIDNVENIKADKNEIDTKWVYDETNSISEKTINFINNLNETVLKDYQYAVYVVDTINDDMDSYKLKLFNDLGVGNADGTNSGILFVLATVDREYGIEIGDGIQGNLRKQLEKNFVVESALSELKRGDWDIAILNVSSHLSKLVIKTDTAPVSNTKPNDVISELIIPNALKEPMKTSTIIGLLFSMIMIGTLLMMDHKSIMFFNSMEFNNFINKADLNKKEVKLEFKENKNLELNENGLYQKSLMIIKDKVKMKYGVDLSILDIQYNYLSEIKDYSSIKHKSLDNLASTVHQVYQEYIIEKERKEEELKKEIERLNLLRNQNISWIDNFVKNNNDYDIDITNETKEDLKDISNIQSTQKETEAWFKRKYRTFEFKNQLKEVFDEEEEFDINLIIKDLQGRPEYERYISGEDRVFKPTKSEQEYKYYHTSNNNIHTNNNFTNSPYFWMWMYGRNHRNEQIKIKAAEIKRNEQMRADEARRAAARRRNASNSSYKSFGGGFGGGSSSGGGFSGKF